MDPLDLAQWKMLTDILSGLATIAALIAAGIWGWYNFGLRREAHPKVQFDLDAEIIARQDGQVLLELSATLQNLGQVRHRISDFTFRLFTLRGSDAIEAGGDRINGQVRFTPIRRDVPWMGHGYSTFIDAGVTQTYRHITAVPDDVTLCMLHSSFDYPDSPGQSHSAQKVRALPGAVPPSASPSTASASAPVP